MRPTTPKLNLAQQAHPPSSPPQTPTTTRSPRFNHRRNGMLFNSMFAKIDPNSGLESITPHGDGPTFSYTPFSKLNPADFSPRSSSPASSRRSSAVSTDDEASDSDDDDEDEDDDEEGAPHSLSSSPAAAPSPPPRRTPTRERIISAVLATFTVEEYNTSDSEISDTDSVLRPHAYEDAESERAASISSKSRSQLNKAKQQQRDEVDTRLLNKMKELDCDEDEIDREAWVEAMRKEKRRKRRSSSSVQKRTISMSIGSDTDEEDLKPLMLLDANEAGSSARRLRRKVGERVSLIFDDPPARIDEEDEGPSSVEEVVEVDEDENLSRELPYWEYIQEDMDIDSDSDDE